MPNWCYTDVTLVGKKENVLRFINCGLANSKVKTETDIVKAFKKLERYGKYYFSISNGFTKSHTKPQKIGVAKGIYFSTFREMPRTFLKYDTTNYAKELPKVVKEQEETYGFVGWFDADIALYGCKWNCEMQNLSLDENDDYTTLSFYTETPWTYPSNFLRWIKDNFELDVLLHTSEEMGNFNFYGELDDMVLRELNIEELEDCPKEEDFEDIEDYWDALNEFSNYKEEEFKSEYFDFVERYERK